MINVYDYYLYTDITKLKKTNGLPIKAMSWEVNAAAFVWADQ